MSAVHDTSDTSTQLQRDHGTDQHGDRGRTRWSVPIVVLGEEVTETALVPFDVDLKQVKHGFLSPPLRHHMMLKQETYTIWLGPVHSSPGGVELQKPSKANLVAFQVIGPSSPTNRLTDRRSTSSALPFSISSPRPFSKGSATM